LPLAQVIAYAEAQGCRDAVLVYPEKVRVGVVGFALVRALRYVYQLEDHIGQERDVS
jgi:hypothetical protein